MVQTPKHEGADWAVLAQEALDLWQEHLAAMAADPKAKAEMTQLIAPLGALLSSWTRPTGGTQNEATHDGAKKHKTRQDGIDSYADDGAASADGARHMAQLADRVAELERHIDILEQRLAGPSAPPAAGPSDASGKGAKRGRRAPSGTGDL